MERKPGFELVLKEQEQVYPAFPVSLLQVYRTVASSSHRLDDHMIVPHIPAALVTALQQLEDSHQELAGQGMAEPACSQRTSDLADRREGHRVTVFVPYKDIVVRIVLAVDTDHSLVMVAQ